MLEAVREQWANMFGWSWRRLDHDAIDGPPGAQAGCRGCSRIGPARRARSRRRFRDLRFVPAYAITASGLLLPLAAPLLGIGIVVCRRAVFTVTGG